MAAPDPRATSDASAPIDSGHHASDLELVRAALARKPGRLEELSNRLVCLPGILDALNGKAGRRLDAHDLADLVQDVLVLAWQKLATYAGESTFETWMYGIARLEMFNALRRRARLRQRSEVLGDRADDLFDEREGGAGISLDFETLHEGLATLEPDESLAIRLKHFEGLTFDAMGRRLGWSSNTAKTRYYRGMSRLEERLRSRFGENEDTK